MTHNTMSYILKYTPPKERCFLTYLDDIKYERFMNNPDKSLKSIKIINFDIIHHQCRGDALSKPISTIKLYLMMIFKSI